MILADGAVLFIGDVPQIWTGLAAAIVGILFWIVGLYVLHWIFERYLKDIDQPEGK